MKHLLLVMLFSLFAVAGQAQAAFSGGPNPGESTVTTDHISVFPNPATDFIGLTNSQNVHAIWIYNMVGRPMKQFKALSNEKYPIGDLLPGIYLVQLLDGNQKVITTRRIRKV